MAVNYKPEQYHSVTPYIVAHGADKVLDFVKKTFNATELFRMPGPNKTIAHAEFQIDDSVIMVSDGGPDHPPQPCQLYVYVKDVDATYRRALEAGGKPDREPSNQFYGDRNASVKDPAGNTWGIATHVEDISPEEMERRAKAAAH